MTQTYLPIPTVDKNLLTEKEFLAKYGDTLVTFKSYYKFTFGFKGETDEGHTVFCSVGGCADDIYKFEVEAGVPISLSALGPSWAAVSNKAGDVLAQMTSDNW